jgi:hypothetical protein
VVEHLLSHLTIECLSLTADTDIEGRERQKSLSSNNPYKAGLFFKAIETFSI